MCSFLHVSHHNTAPHASKSPAISATDLHWITGDTYPHRELLKRWGCRWSKRRKSWYWIGDTLPDAIQTLIDTVNTPIESQPPKPTSDEDNDPCSIEEA